MSNTILSQNIKKFRKKIGWSMDQLSKKADIPFSSLNNIEMGRTKSPSIETLVKLANAFNISLDQLVGRNV